MITGAPCHLVTLPSCHELGATHDDDLPELEAWLDRRRIARRGVCWRVVQLRAAWWAHPDQRRYRGLPRAGRRRQPGHATAAARSVRRVLGGLEPGRE